MKRDNLIIPIETQDVNRLRVCRLVAKKTYHEMATEIKKVHPRFDKYLQKKCEHTEAYGIQLSEPTLKALEKQFLPEKKKVFRAKPCRVTVRFEFSDYQALQYVLGQGGYSAQGFCHDAILMAINDELEGVSK